MGIMPADRELKWQRVFRRFGLPGDASEKGGKPTEKPNDRRRNDETDLKKARDGSSREK